MKKLMSGRSAMVRAGVMVAGFFLLTGFMMSRFVEDTHYRVIPGGAATSSPEVVEFFSYGCPHCRAVEPELEKWMATKPAGVTVKRIPAAWNESYESLARFYLALEALGLAEKHTERIFAALHDERRKLFGREEQIEFAATDLGLDKKVFTDAYDSEAVSKKLQEGKDLFVRYRVASVPAFVVNGQYFTNVTMGGHGSEVFDVINFLLELKK